MTDIDGTLLGESETTLQLRRELLAARAALAQSGVKLRWAVATGRDIASAREVLLESGFELSDFDALVTSVGAELYLHGEASPAASYTAALTASGFDAAQVRTLLDGLPGLDPQPEHEQFPHKVCYFIEDQPELRRRVQGALADLPFTTTVVFAMGGYLDVAPNNGAKGGAVAHLLDLWGIAPTRAVAAGDSGNDLSMLERHWHAIVVGNGHTELASLRGRRGVYFAEQKYAAGVLEGLAALGFL